MNTAATILKEDIARTREEIARLTGISIDEQFQISFEAAYDWLELITHNDARVCECLPKTKEFWGFWKCAWQKVDAEFLVLEDKCTLGRQAANFYKCMHRISWDNVHLNNRSVQAQYNIIRNILTN